MDQASALDSDGASGTSFPQLSARHQARGRFFLRAPTKTSTGARCGRRAGATDQLGLKIVGSRTRGPPSRKVGHSVLLAPIPLHRNALEARGRTSWGFAMARRRPGSNPDENRLSPARDWPWLDDRHAGPARWVACLFFLKARPPRRSASVEVVCRNHLFFVAVAIAAGPRTGTPHRRLVDRESESGPADAGFSPC